jgi:hypothetical protein
MATVQTHEVQEVCAPVQGGIQKSYIAVVLRPVLMFIL